MKRADEENFFYSPGLSVIDRMQDEIYMGQQRGQMARGEILYIPV
jgi:hypothetical protein